MLGLMEELGRRAGEALAHAHGALPEGATVTVERSNKADLQTAAALQLAKKLGKKPRELADTIAAALGGHAAVAAAEVAGPGFVNVTLRDGWLAATVATATTLRARGAGQTVVIDYSSPNVAKPLHIGHIRSNIIGDALKRALVATGYNVVADNHLGDWGTQFGKLLVAWRRWLDPAAYAADPVAELLRLYIRFGDEEDAERQALTAAAGDATRAEAGKAEAAKADAADEAEADEGDDEGKAKGVVTPLLGEARAELVKLQQGDPENLALWKQFMAVSLADLDRVYRRLDIHFDVMHGESFYNDRLPATVDRLLADGIAEESRGALVIFFRKPDGGEEMPPFIVRKADGGYNYATTDIATVLYRVERWNPVRILVVTDERQQLHFRQLYATARRLGVTCSLEHIWFGLMRLPEGVIATRAGRQISLTQLLDEAEAHALTVAREHSEGLDEATLREVARVVGLGAIKYNDLSRDRQSIVTFTWDKALSLTGNSGPYLQYAYARIQSILRKAAGDGAEPGDVAPSLLPAERALALALCDFGAAVEAVAATTRPHLLCDYLFALAGTFSSFYAECPVIKAEPATRASRLALCRLTGETLRRGLDLLGIEVLDRM